MITPRRITLHRVNHLAAYRAILTDWIIGLPPERVSDTCVIVPTRAAAEQLRRTVETRGLTGKRRAILWPPLLTRNDVYDELASRLPLPPRLLSASNREILLGAAARGAADAGLQPPYQLRPGLIAEMLGLYDLVRRLGRGVDDFERNFVDELEKEQDTDRGAARLLQQTIFLSAAYRGYEQRLATGHWWDEHRLRDELARIVPQRPLSRAIVSVADRVAEADGLWPADFDLLARLPQLEQIDLIGTEGVLAAGYLERLYVAFPELAEERPAGPPWRPPLLTVPDAESTFYSYRDREEELLGVARRLKVEHHDGSAAPLHRTALLVRRPLPYLYLARDVFADAAIPFEALDTMPLAAEPYAAALDVVLDVVRSDFSRASLLALLRSPHFSFGERDDGWHSAIGALDTALAEARYLGGFDRLQALSEKWASLTAASSREERRQQRALPAMRQAVTVAAELRPLAEHRRMVDQISHLLDWLRRFDRPEAAAHVAPSPRSRVRAAILGALTALADAYTEHDPDAEGELAALTAAIRRSLGAQTFAMAAGEGGVQLVDASAARYGEFDDVQIVGMVDGDWPERPRRNVLYPASLLSLLEPPPRLRNADARERDSLQSARASFRDLVLSATRFVRLSTFVLENDSVVEGSLLLDDVVAFGLGVVAAPLPLVRATHTEAVALDPKRPEVLPEPARTWAALRIADADNVRERRPGEAGVWQMPRVSVSRLELFLSCPFKFFAAHVLRLEEEPEDQAIQTPLERGRFLHDLWERFFSEWQRRGAGRIDQDRLPQARALFAELCEEALAALSPVEAALERHKLLGSAVSPGIAHRVFAMEASRPTHIVERLLEYPLEGEFRVSDKSGGARTVVLNAKTDRIDVLEGGRLRVIDYKSKTTPDQKLALQLPIYAQLAREQLQRARGGHWSLDEAMYVSFEGDKAVVPLRPAKGQTLDDVVSAAEHRLIEALDRIAAGHFPPQPAKKSMCVPCGYRSVCRLELKSPDGEGGSEGVEGEDGQREGS